MSAQRWGSISLQHAHVVDLSSLDEVPFREAVRVSGPTLLGEHPEWNEALGGVVWVDIDAGETRFWDGTADRVLYRTPGPIGAAVGASDGTLVLAASPRVLSFAPKAGTVLESQAGPGIGMRYNDASLAPDGALWVGELPLDEAPEGGRLVRIDLATGETQELLGGMGCPNGIVWPGAGSRALVCESDTRRIAEAEVDPRTGIRMSWRIAYEFQGASDVVPDGLLLEPDGTLWVALWGAGAVIRITTAGDILESVRVDDPHTTSVCRAPDGTVFVTAASGLYRTTGDQA